MNYIMLKLNGVGIKASTPKAVIEEALQIKSGAALEMALRISILGIGWVIDMEYRDKVINSEELRQLKKAAFKAFLNQPRVKEVRQMLNAIQHEAI